MPVTHDIQAFSDYITPAHSNIPSQFNKVVNKFQKIQNKIGSYVDDFKHSRYGDTYDLYEMGNNVRKDVKTMKKNFSDYYSVYNALQPGYSDDPIES